MSEKGFSRDKRDRYIQIAAEMRANIMANELPAGSQLPSTHWLIKAYNTSSATITRTIALLKAEGLLSSVIGKGVYVREHQPFVIRASTYFTPSPGGWSYDLIRVAEEVPPRETREALGLLEDETAILRHRLTRFNDEPVDLSWLYYPLSIVEGSPITQSHKIKGGVPRVLAELGYPQRRFTERVSARMPTSEEMHWLDLPGEVPVIRQLSTVHSDNDVVVEAGILIKGANRFELEFRENVVDQ